MDSGFPLAPSFNATYPMMPTHFMGMNPSAFHKGMQNYDTQSMPWVSSHSPIDMSSPLKSSPWSTYMNPSIGSGGTMAPMPTSSFDMSHVPQPDFTWEVGISPLTDPFLTMLFQEPILKWVLILLTIPLFISFILHVGSFEHFSHDGSSCIPECFIRGKSVLLWATLFMEPLHKGESYILT
jgi:hypothetical protein